MSQEMETLPPHELRLDELQNGKKQGASDTASEKEMLVQRRRRVSTATAYQLRKVILAISWISVVYLGIMGIIVFVLAFIKGNSTAFAFSLDALLDCASSAVVIWRYSGPAASLYSAKRERIACVILGILFIISFFSISVRSAYSLILQEHPKRSYALWVISIINGVMCIGLTASKAVLAKKLESITVATDAVNSGIGLIIAVSTVVSDLLYDNNTSLWYIDPVIGIICSLFLLVYGIWVIIYQVCLSKPKDDD